MAPKKTPPSKVPGTEHPKGMTNASGAAKEVSPLIRSPLAKGHENVSGKIKR
jgi:hypothetical protein